MFGRFSGIARRALPNSRLQALDSLLQIGKRLWCLRHFDMLQGSFGMLHQCLRVSLFALHHSGIDMLARLFQMVCLLRLSNA